MIEICIQESCTGCSACSNVCAADAIRMVTDQEGFLRPVIDNDKCKDCGLCKKICPANTSDKFLKPIDIYSGWSANSKTRLTSSSGGVFWELASHIINIGGYAVGCLLDENFVARHAVVNTIEGLTKLKGSKYTQSVIGTTFQETKNLLQGGKIVLFSGTPCQVAGLRAFLRKDYDNLLTIDVICHGVPSPKLFRDYLDFIKSRNNISKIETISFREKRTSWMLYNMNIQGINPNGQSVTYIGGYLTDPWIRGFLGDNFLRPCCYTCKYSKPERVSDFTIADWWSYVPKDKDYSFLQKGVSSLTCNTSKARMLLNLCMSNLILQKRTLEDYLKTNPSLTHSWKAPDTRDEFWNQYKKYGFNVALVHKYMPRKRLILLRHISMRNRSSQAIRIFIKLLEKKNFFLKKFKLDKYQIKF